MRRIGVGLAGLAFLATACSGGANVASHPSPITVIHAGVDKALIGVPAPMYQVSVATSGNVWVQAVVPGEAIPSYSGVMPPGETRSFASASGRVALQLGATQVKVIVHINGRTTPTWRYTPTVSPFTLNFTSVSE